MLSYRPLVLAFTSCAFFTGLTACGGKPSVNEDCSPAASNANYCLVWQDEFQTSNLDLERWQFEVNCWGGGNNEAQCYTSNANNLWLDGEALHIQARQEATQGPSLPMDDPDYNADDTSGTGTFTSARIRSKNRGDWQYGRMEVRAKLPQGQGTWPAIWMLPTDEVYGTWASSGEIDIMEAVNLKVDGEASIHGTLHYGDLWPNNVYSGEAYTLPNQQNPADDFHTYAVEWEEGEIRWYVDDIHYATQQASGWYSTQALDNPMAPFDQPFHLILNLAVGGDWAAKTHATGIDESAFPQEMVVDYVRVYECSLDPITGKGCASKGTQFVLNPGTPPPTPIDTDVPVLTMFEDTLAPQYQWFTYKTLGTVEWAVMTLSSAPGAVAQLNLSETDGIGFIQSGTPADYSGFESVSFDWRVVSDTRGPNAAFYFRADCNYPCTSGNVPLTSADLGVWQTTQINASDLANGGLDLNRVNTPFVFGANTTDATITVQIDNITWQ